MKKPLQTTLLVGVIIAVSLYAYCAKTLSGQHYLKNDRETFTINTGENVKDVSERLESKGIITSARLLRLYLSWKGFDTKLLGGEFHFFSPISIFSVAEQLIQKPNKPLIIVTIPEGYDNTEIATLFAKKNNKLSKEKLLLEIEKRDVSGYLFPDTYFLSGKENEEQIIQKMLVNFTEKYNNRFLDTKENLITLLNDQAVRKHISEASILEGEAKTEKDMQIIAGILEKREKLGMRLQVDVAKETYTTKGFPEIAINNPGLISLRAAKNPIKTNYLYYVTGNDGNMYYATTFAEHKKNIAKYLK